VVKHASIAGIYPTCLCGISDLDGRYARPYPSKTEFFKAGQHIRFRKERADPYLGS